MPSVGLAVDSAVTGSHTLPTCYFAGISTQKPAPVLLSGRIGARREALRSTGTGMRTRRQPGSRKIKFAVDSPLEGDGFEPSVPSERGSGRAAPVRLRWSPEQCPGAARRSWRQAPDEVGPPVRIPSAPLITHGESGRYTSPRWATTCAALRDRRQYR
jgi:hypothetical protein